MGLFCYVLSTWHKSWPERRKLNREKASIRLACTNEEGPSHCVECYHWTGSHGLYKKEAGQAMGSKPVRNLAPNSVSMFLLESHPYNIPWKTEICSINKMNSFLSKPCFVSGLLQQQTANQGKNMFKLYCILVWKYPYENQYHVQWMCPNETN